MRILLLAGLFCSLSVTVRAQDTLLSLRLLERIEQLQPKTDGVFNKGLFPSYRMYALNKDRQKADVNVFFTGLIMMTLRDLQPRLTPYQQKIASRIVERAAPATERFKNQKGKPAYHFWPADVPQIFPNGGWLNLFNKSQSLPPDMDDTAIMLLALAAADSTAARVHAYMQGFTNNPAHRIQNTAAQFRDLPAYSTWFGVKMPVDFDICVLSNVLYMVQRYQLPWTAADSASVQVIKGAVASGLYRTAPGYIAPHYARTPIILYHIARLMQVKPMPELDSLKAVLVATAREQLQQSNRFMDQVLLLTALKRWGVTDLPIIQHDTNAALLDLVEDESFSFFIANMASMLPDTLKKWINSTSLGTFYYYCPAYNQLLLLENLLQ
jgi:hypothetical protein